MSKQPPPAPTASAVGPCPTIIQIVGRPGTGSLPSTIVPPDHPPQFNKETGECGLFAAYVNIFLKIKQEASGWPEWVKTDEDRPKYIADYAENEGIELNPESISKNPALRSIAKLILNSFWGKFGQNMKKPKTSFFSRIRI